MLGSQCWVLGSGFRDRVQGTGQCWVPGSGFRDWVLSARRVSFRGGGGGGG